jgi:hypothetical protein
MMIIYGAVMSLVISTFMLLAFIICEIVENSKRKSSLKGNYMDREVEASSLGKKEKYNGYNKEINIIHSSNQAIMDFKSSELDDISMIIAKEDLSLDESVLEVVDSTYCNLAETNYTLVN